MIQEIKIPIGYIGATLYYHTIYFEIVDSKHVKNCFKEQSEFIHNRANQNLKGNYQTKKIINRKRSSNYEGIGKNFKN